MPSTGAEQLVVVMKRSNVRGAKGLRHSVLTVSQPERGGTHGYDKAVTFRLNDGSRMSGDVHVRFYEGLGVKLPGATHPVTSRHSGISKL
jgi:hypothetical protein